MRKSWFLALAFLLLLFIPTAVCANVYMPTFVRMVTSPLHGILVFPIPLAIIFMISCLEALVLRRFAPDLGFWKLTGRLIIINLITSLIGTFALPTGTELWPGLLIAFVLTVPLEALALWLFEGHLPESTPFRYYLKASTWMNSASYTVLAIALAAMIYLPMRGNENPRLLQELSGKLVVADIAGLETVTLDHGKATKTKSDIDFQPPDLTPSALNGFFDGTTHYRFVDNKWQSMEFGTPPSVLSPIAISPDGKLVLDSTAQRSQVVYLSTGKTLKKLAPELSELTRASFSYDGHLLLCEKSVLDDAWLVDLQTGQQTRLEHRGRYARFCPSKPELAWTNANTVVFYDCLSKKKRTLTLPGSTVGITTLAWSPDGRYIAYLGNVNPYTAQNWTPDLRVVRTDGSGSATVYENICTNGWLSAVIWLK
jgi:hypothetical protein